MNPYCCACENPATRVCKHPQCSYPSFYCQGPCAKGIARTMHTHNGREDFISYSDFQKKLIEIKNVMNPHSLHKVYLDQIKKEIQLIKDNLSDQLDETYQRLESDLLNRVNIQVSQEIEMIVKKIDQQEASQLKGATILRFLEWELDIAKSKSAWAKIKCIKQSFYEWAEVVMKLDIQGMYVGYDERVEKSKVLFDEGMDLRNSKNLDKALQKFKEAHKINNFDYRIHSSLAYCFDQLGDLDEAQRSYKNSLGLNPSFHSALNNVGHIYKKRGNLEQAVRWYSQALEKDSEYALALSNRGNSYMDLKKYKQALVDYNRLFQMNPESKEYIEKMAEITDLMRRQIK